MSDSHKTPEPQAVQQAPEPRPKYVVWYGSMAFIGEFDSKTTGLRPNINVVVRSPRGTELGQIVCPATGKIDEEFKNAGHILRVATESDVHRQEYIDQNQVPGEMLYCRNCIEERKLPMKVVGMDHLFGGDKIIFYFLAEGRVDFRELVRDLAKRFETRIELTQIGVRDEARLLGDCNYCGRPLCCKTFIKRLETVTMKMAKNQKATLDPSKISGRCGRLMCCLRFENKVYDELKRKLPKKGSYVQAGKVTGRVVGVDVLQQTVTVSLKESGATTFSVDEVVPAPKPQPSRRPDSESDKGAQTPKGDTRRNSSRRARPRNATEDRKPDRRDEERPRTTDKAADGPRSDAAPEDRPSSPAETGPPREGRPNENRPDGSGTRGSRRRRGRGRRRSANRRDNGGGPKTEGGSSNTPTGGPKPQDRTPRNPTPTPDIPTDSAGPAKDSRESARPDWMEEAQLLLKDKPNKPQHRGDRRDAP